MDVRLLGPVVALDDHDVALGLGGEKQRSVFAILALRANSLVSVDALAEGVWGDDMPERFPQNVQVYVSTLRRIIEPLRTRSMPSRIITRGTGYELVLGPEEIDIGRFRSLVSQGTSALESGQPATAAMHTRAALAEWRGTPCADLLYVPFAASFARPLEEERWAAFELCMAAELAAGRARELVPELEQAVAEEPLREALWAQLVRALYGAGRQADALNACRRARELLVEGLGIEPGEGLRRLEQQVLEQDRALDPPRGSAIRTARLPVPLTSLIGRRALVAEVREALSQRRLVTLTGPGGVGKTRVALAVAADAAGIDIDSVFVDLSNEHDAARVAPAIAVALGAPNAQTIDELVRGARDSAPLLVLDNFEQLLDASDLVHELLAGLPDAKALVTSRTRLGIAGERVIEVEPLGVSDQRGESSPAVELFGERAIEADPRFDPTRHRDAIISICTALEGVPLAIELAASRLAVLEPAELFERVGAAVDIVVRRGPERHRSLRAAIEWSLELLDPAELLMLTLVSICEGPFDLPTALALGLAGGLEHHHAELAFETLVRSSLVRGIETPSGRRFTFLTTIRSVAAEHLDAENEELARAGHAHWFVDRLGAYDASDDATAAASLPGAVADLRDAISAVRWLIDRDQGDEAATAVVAMHAISVAKSGEFTTVRTLADEIRSRCRLTPNVAARLRVIAGNMAYMVSDLALAQRELTAVDELDPADDRFLARGSMMRAVLAADTGDHRAARAHAELARTHARRHGTHRLIGLALSASSYAAIAANDPAAALEWAHERLALEEPGTLGAANGLTEAAYALIELGRIDEAKEFATDGLVSARRLGVAQPIGDSFRGLAWCALLERTPRDAASALLDQLAAFEQADGMIDRVVEVGLSAALAAADAGDIETARFLWNRTQSTLGVLDVSIDNWPVELRRRGDVLGDGATPGAGPAGAPEVALSELMVTVRAVLRRLAAAPLPNAPGPVPG